MENEDKKWNWCELRDTVAANFLGENFFIADNYPSAGFGDKELETDEVKGIFDITTSCKGLMAHLDKDSEDSEGSEKLTPEEVSFSAATHASMYTMGHWAMDEVEEGNEEETVTKCEARMFWPSSYKFSKQFPKWYGHPAVKTAMCPGSHHHNRPRHHAQVNRTQRAIVSGQRVGRQHHRSRWADVGKAFGALEKAVRDKKIDALDTDASGALEKDELIVAVFAPLVLDLFDVLDGISTGMSDDKWGHRDGAISSEELSYLFKESSEANGVFSALTKSKLAGSDKEYQRWELNQIDWLTQHAAAECLGLSGKIGDASRKIGEKSICKTNGLCNTEC